MANIRLLPSVPLQRWLSVGTVDSFQGQERASFV
jgi:superfamily I DNA and/or RNA helicase